MDLGDPWIYFPGAPAGVLAKLRGLADTCRGLADIRGLADTCRVSKARVRRRPARIPNHPDLSAEAADAALGTIGHPAPAEKADAL